MKIQFKMAMAVMAAVMVLGASSVAVFAQGTEPPAAGGPPATPTPPAQTKQYNQTFWDAFAKNLGTTVEKVQQALRDALKSTVAQALKDGKLTQEQADKANTGIDKLPFDKPLFGEFLRGRGQRQFDAKMFAGKAELEAAAQKLGMTTQEVTTALREGKTLADLAKEKNVSADDLKAAMVTAVKAQIDQAVKDGKLTQAQADELKAKVEQGITLDKPLFKGGLPGHRPFAPRGKAPQPQAQ